MIVELDECKTIKIDDACIIVKNGRLFNTVTKQFEGVDGDRVTFYVNGENGNKCWISGTVDGYTCNRRVKLKGVNKLYAIASDCTKVIDSLSRITDTDCEEQVEEIKNDIKIEEEKNDWELILSSQ